MKVVNHGTDTFVVVMQRRSLFYIQKFIDNHIDDERYKDVVEVVAMLQEKMLEATMIADSEEQARIRDKYELENMHEVS